MFLYRETKTNVKYLQKKKKKKKKKKTAQELGVFALARRGVQRWPADRARQQGR
jgi:hypothetical protein